MHDLGEDQKENRGNCMSKEVKQHEVHVVQYGFREGWWQKKVEKKARHKVKLKR